MAFPMEMSEWSEAYQRAIGLESDPAVRRFLQAELAREQQVRAESLRR